MPNDVRNLPSHVNTETRWLSVSVTYTTLSLSMLILEGVSSVSSCHCPRPPNLPQKSSLCCEHLNTMVASISHIHIPSAVTCHIPGVMELSIVTAFTAKAAGECQVRVQNLNDDGSCNQLQCTVSCSLGG